MLNEIEKSLPLQTWILDNAMQASVTFHIQALIVLSCLIEICT